MKQMPIWVVTNGKICGEEMNCFPVDIGIIGTNEQRIWLHWI